MLTTQEYDPDHILRILHRHKEPQIATTDGLLSQLVDLEKQYPGIVRDYARLRQDEALLGFDIDRARYYVDKTGELRLESQISNAYSGAAGELEETEMDDQILRVQAAVTETTRRIVQGLVTGLLIAMKHRAHSLSGLRESRQFQRHVIVCLEHFVQRLRTQAYDGTEALIVSQLTIYRINIAARVLNLPLWEVRDVAADVRSHEWQSNAVDLQLYRSSDAGELLREDASSAARSFVLSSEAYHKLEESICIYRTLTEEPDHHTKSATPQDSRLTGLWRRYTRLIVHRGRQIVLHALDHMSLFREPKPRPGMTRIRWRCVSTAAVKK